jgi:Spherulation-specific family 4
VRIVAGLLHGRRFTLAAITRPPVRRRLLALVISAGLALVGSAGVALPLGSARAQAAPLELIPAYFGPEGSPDPWHTMCEAAPAGSTVILNPDNGPVKKDAKVYAAPIRLCEERGQRVIGYVYTRYGERSLGAVEKAVTDYYRWYPAVEGIFLDEMAEVPTAKVEAYYRQLAAYVHGKGGFVVGNPGDTAATSWQLGDVDEVVTFEGSAGSYATYSPAPWVLTAQAQQIVGGDDEVGALGDLTASSKGEAVDRCEDRLAQLPQGVEGAVEVLTLTQPLLLAHALALTQVAAHRERAVASASDDRDTDGRLNRDRLQDLSQALAHLGRSTVPRRSGWVVQRRKCAPAAHRAPVNPGTEDRRRAHLLASPVQAGRIARQRSAQRS